MSRTRAPSDRYEIRIQGHLDARWADWFDGFTLTLESDGTTLIDGPVIDQAALHGLLQKVRDTGLSLVSVIAAGPDRHHDTASPATRHQPRSST